MHAWAAQILDSWGRGPLLFDSNFLESTTYNSSLVKIACSNLSCGAVFSVFAFPQEKLYKGCVYTGVAACFACGYCPWLVPFDSAETIVECYRVLLLKGQCHDCFQRPLACRPQMNCDVLVWAERTLSLVFLSLEEDMPKTEYMHSESSSVFYENKTIVDFF